MNEKIEAFYCFSETNPQTGEIVPLWAIKVASSPAFIIIDNKDDARSVLKQFCRQNNYLSAADVLKDENYAQMTREEMCDFLANGDENSVLYQNDFNFFNVIRKKTKTETDNKDSSISDSASIPPASVQASSQDVTSPVIPTAVNQSSQDLSPKKEGKISKILAAVKKQFKKTSVKITAFGASLAAIVSLIACGATKLNETNEYAGSPIVFEETTDNNTNDETTAESETEAEQTDTFDENTATFDELVAHTNDAFKKSFMTRFREAITYFNGTFANRHSDYNKETKLCLSVEELEAWYMAVNGKDLSLEQVVSIFDKVNLDKEIAIENYKSSYLQMFLAAVVQTEPTKLDGIIESEAGKKFYTTYESMCINSNLETDATKQKQIYKDFFEMTFADFKVENEMDFSHSNLKEMGIENYYSSVLPIIDAMNEKIQRYGAEIGFSSEELADYESKVARIHDEIMCDLPYQNVRDVADRLQIYQISNPDKEYSDPSHDNYMRAIRDELVKEGNYNLEDRDISKLNIFADSMHVRVDENVAENSGYAISETTTRIVSQRSESTTSSKTETTKTDISREEAVKEVGENAVEEAERKADQEAGIPAKNQQAKDEAEKAADEEAKRQQAIEDRKGQEIDKKIEEEKKKTDASIDKANEWIDQGAHVRPETPNIQIDKDHTNSDGNINGGVSNITKDPTDAVKPNDPLPDPNETGKDFDNNTNNSEISDIIIEEEVDVEPYNAETSVETYYQAAEQLVNQMATGEVSVVLDADEGTIEVVPTEQETTNSQIVR